MTASIAAFLLLVGTPVLAAAVGLLMWSKPEVLKVWLLLATGISLGAIAWIAGTGPAQSSGVLFLLSLLPLLAFVTLLGQPLHARNVLPSLLTLLLLGLGLGVLASESPLSPTCLLLLLALVGLMLLYDPGRARADRWWAIGTLGLGVLGLVISVTTVPPVSSIAFALACAIALPLVPFHNGYVAALMRLPGNLPAFLAVLLPVVGFHGLMTVLPQFPQALSEMVAILALGGMLYGSLQALTQSRAAAVVAYGSLAFLSILWWSLVMSRGEAPRSVVYVSAVSLATSGLLLAWYMLRARYGEIGLRALSGLAHPMPRFAVAVSLLALAALGLPPFGVFAGFMGVLLAPSFTWSGAMVVIIIAWLSASWYLFDLVQGLLFGRHQPERRYEDLRDPELASLAIILMLLIALGAIPSRMLNVEGPELSHVPRTAAMEVPAWNE